MPAAQNDLANSHATGKATEAGFRITVLPAANAAATPPTGIANGKFHGGMTSTIPFGVQLMVFSSAKVFIVIG